MLLFLLSNLLDIKSAEDKLEAEDKKRKRKRRVEDESFLNSKKCYASAQVS